MCPMCVFVCPRISFLLSICTWLHVAEAQTRVAQVSTRLARKVWPVPQSQSTFLEVTQKIVRSAIQPPAASLLVPRGGWLIHWPASSFEFEAWDG